MILSTEKIREKWLSFFKNKDHFELPFCSLIPIDDLSLLWINSGIATLKPYFEGKKNPPHNQLVNCQKSIRTNDIENVGYTARHHTLFEMLGNFSIGSYFKHEAISFAWEFLTSSDWLNLDKSNIYVTVYEKDKVTYDIWVNKIKIDSSKIIKGNKTQNFWEIGAGPSGPNTEIFYDRGEKYDSDKIGLELLKKNIENDRYIEIWNIVFSEFNHDGKGHYELLPRKNIDTGAGLERLATIIQNVPTNFDTDIFQKIIKKISILTNNKYFYDMNNYFTNEKNQKKINISFKIISDHIRAIVFAITDGAYPNNKNQGYVIRRLIRRSMMYGEKIGLSEPFLYKLVDVVINSMGQYYKYLTLEKDKVKQIILNEENKFLKTLIEGKEQLLSFIKKNNNVTSKQVFMLYESFGYPFELTSEICNQYNIKINKKDFDLLLLEHVNISKINKKQIASISKQNKFLMELNFESNFVGYNDYYCNDSKIISIFKNNKFVDGLSNEKCFIILDKTPFYAEKGGQASDQGIIKNNDFICNVLDVQTGLNNEHIHYVEIIDGIIKNNSVVEAKINIEKRLLTMKNHSGTHIIHSAIRQILGKNTKQIGSYNDERYLRIDIAYEKKITLEQIRKINLLCLEKISKKMKSEIIYCSYDKAINDLHALAFFKDKYDLSKKVRVVKFDEFSIELCAGTHVNNSKNIESLLITKCNSIGNNVYRFTALTSHNTVDNYLIDLKKKIDNLFIEIEFINTKLKKNISIKLDNDANNVFDELIKINDNIKKLTELKKTLMINLKKSKTIDELKKFKHFIPKKFQNNLKIISSSFKNVSSDVIKNLIIYYRNKFNINLLIVFFNVIDTNNGIIYLSISENLKNKYNCGEIIKKIKTKINIKGGGNSIQAQCSYNYDSNKIINFFMKELKELC